MKYVIVIPDGCADEPVAALGQRTPLQAARKPNLDRLARVGRVGRANNVPAGLTPASDVATLSLFGYDPERYYTGRAPLEAAAMGIGLGPRDWAIRCNLVCIENGQMRDFTAGHISSAEGKELIAALQEKLGGPEREFFPGVSYRNLLVFRGSAADALDRTTRTQAPHDIPDQAIQPHLPQGRGADALRDLMDRSRPLFETHPVNEKRRQAGQRPATQVWLWGQGQAPSLPSFASVYGPRGAMVTAVDLVRGVAALLGWKRIDVPGATGYLDTDYAAKGRYAIATLADHDLVCVHVEAPDEASHEGKAAEKVKAIEEIDRHIVGPLLEALPRFGPHRMLVSPDHPTPLRTRAHAHGYVPFVIGGEGIASLGQASYDEFAAAASPIVFDRGWELMRTFLS